MEVTSFDTSSITNIISKYLTESQILNGSFILGAIGLIILFLFLLYQWYKLTTFDDYYNTVSFNDYIMVVLEIMTLIYFIRVLINFIKYIYNKLTY